jgi:glutamate 5-kinase
MMKRIVIKVGSNVLTRDNGKIDVTRLSAIVDQLAWLRRRGHEVILVSSGSIACGHGEMRALHKLDKVEQRQLFSAIGQVKLINLYYDFFREHGIHIGQILTMKESFATRHEYLNQRACMNVMLQNGVLPIVNENDTVSVTELMFTDNDELSGLIASMMNADMLIILTNVDGIYDGNPKDAASKVIPVVDAKSDLTDCIVTDKSDFGRGGMITKSVIAAKIADEGIDVMIANGRRDNIIIDLISNPAGTVHTEFLPNSDGVSGVKKWIAHSESFAKGAVSINANAADALNGTRAVSLLMVGVTAVDGDFEEGDIVNIVDADGRVIGLGRSSYGSDDARRLIGCHEVKPMVHYDYMYLEHNHD